MKASDLLKRIQCWEWKYEPNNQTCNNYSAARTSIKTPKSNEKADWNIVPVLLFATFPVHWLCLVIVAAETWQMK